MVVVLKSVSAQSHVLIAAAKKGITIIKGVFKALSNIYEGAFLQCCCKHALGYGCILN